MTDLAELNKRVCRKLETDPTEGYICKAVDEFLSNKTKESDDEI